MNSFCNCADCPCYQDEDGDWFFDVKTFEWDEYNDDFVRIRVGINYCPFCGKELKGLTNNEC